MKISAFNQWAMRLLLVSAALAALPAAAQIEVRAPNGDYREQAEDLRVKVLGGSVSVQRTWQFLNVNKGEYRWYFNPAWADLTFEYEATDDSVKSVGRAGARYERGGDGVYVFDKQFFMTRQADAQGATTGWRWYDRKGNWALYAADGKATSYGDRNDVAVRFARGGPSGEITEVKDHHGVTALTFRYAGGHLQSVTDRAQRRVEYVYSGNDLVEVVDATGQRWKYGYTNGLLTSRTDPEQHVTKIDYAGGRVFRLTDAMNYVRTWEYDYNRAKRQYTVTAKGPEAARIVKRVYDATGRLISEITGTRETYALRRDGDSLDIETGENGMASRTTYDASGNAIKVVRADGTYTTATFDPVFNLPREQVDELGVKTVNTYDAKGNLRSTVEATGLPEQRAATFTYDDYGQMLTMTIEGATDADDVTTTRTYDDFGNIASVVDAEGRKTTFEYDARGLQTLRVDARGKRWTQEYDARGALLRAANPLGQRTRYEYDKAGNLVKSIDPLDRETVSTYTANNWIETRTFPDGGVRTMTYTKDGKPKTVTDERGVVTTIGYDPDGRFARVVDSSGNERVAEYDAAAGDKPSGMRFQRYCDKYRYDQRGRRVEAVRTTPCTGDDRTTMKFATAYDSKGRIVATTDELGHTTMATYDALGRLVTATDANGGISRTAYDALSNRIATTDANDRTYTWRYDKVGRVRSESTPLGNEVAYRYDPAGNLLERTSAAGGRRQYSYDDAGNTIGEKLFDAGSNTPSQTIVYAYTALGELASYVQSGDVQAAATYEYDGASRRTAETVTYGAGAAAFSRTTRYAYWPNGLKKSLTYPDGTQVEFGYNGLNQLESATLPGGGAIRWSDYVWRNALTVESPGIVARREFDVGDRMTRQSVQAVGSGDAHAPSGAVLVDDRYRYDAAGNLLERTTTDGTYAYTYDALDRLLTALPPASLARSEQNPAGLPREAYTYDPLGNRLGSAADPGEWRYSAENQLLAHGIGSAMRTYDYDTAGLVSRIRTGSADAPSSALELRYDAAERLRDVLRDGQRIARYQYDPFGRRTRKETAHGVTWFQYSDEGVIAEFDAGGAPRRLYGRMPGPDWSRSPLWQADRDGAGWRVATYQLDPMGMPQQLVDANGASIWSRHTGAFGDAAEEAGGGDSALLFPGQYQDDETGFVYNWNRYYQPETGRYLQWDPIRRQGGPNPYLYVAANPLRFVDPDGLKIFRDRCNCNEDFHGNSLWVGVEGTASYMFKTVAGGTGSVGVFSNVMSGEVCLRLKSCIRVGINIGSGASLSGTGAAEVGHACGMHGDNTSICEAGVTLVDGRGGRFSGVISQPLGGNPLVDCGDSPLMLGKEFEIPLKGVHGGVSIGMENSVSSAHCRIRVLKCWNTPCACEKKEGESGGGEGHH